MSALRLIDEFSATSVTSLSATDVFSADFDIYKITTTEWNNPSANTDMNIRLIDSDGIVISASEYDHARQNLRSYSSATEVREQNVSYLGYGTYIASGQSYSAGQSMYLLRPFDSASYTFALIENSFSFGTSGNLSTKGIAVHKSAEKITGIQFYSRSGATVDINMKVYGLRVDS